jgi:hypothetical protein
MKLDKGMVEVEPDLFEIVWGEDHVVNADQFLIEYTMDFCYDTLTGFHGFLYYHILQMPTC